MSDFTIKLDSWVNSYSKSSGWYNQLKSADTKKAFLAKLFQYCESVKMNPDELIALKIQGLQNVNTDKEFMAEELLNNFLMKSTCPKSTLLCIRTTVKSFYKKNNRDLINIIEVVTPNPKERTPKPNDLLDLENAMPTLRDKSIVWFFGSTPVRLRTLTRLTWGDLKPTNDKDVPYYIIVGNERLKGAGNSKYKSAKHVGFLHKLAVQKLDAYKAELIRKGYQIKNSDPLFVAYYSKEHAIKALAGASIEELFTNASLKAWGDLELKRFSPHDIRAMFQTQLEDSGLNENIISPMMSHVVNGVAKHYSSHDIETFLAKFKQALPFILPQSIEKVKSELDQTTSKLTETENKLLEATNAIKQINAYLAKGTTDYQNDTAQIKAIRDNL